MKKIILYIIIISFVGIGFSRSLETFKLNDSEPPREGLAGNGVTDILGSDDALWIGTGHGLSRTMDDGITFETLGTEQGLGKGSISALWVSGDTVLVATAADTFTIVSDSYLPMGTGISLSIDGGETWSHSPQPGVTPVQNLSYDIAVLDGTIWITSFGGGMSKSEDWGETWETVTPDSFVFDPGGRLNHRAFSVISVNNDLWVGTAEGINRSSDNGETWTSFTYKNQPSPISGNFIVAMAHQKTDDKNLIWAATWKALDEEEEYGVSVSDNNGASWRQTLIGNKAHNFGFDGNIAYVATDSGLFKSDDFGETWFLFPKMHDTVTGERVYTSEIYSVFGDNGAVWVGTADGLAKTENNGYTWDIDRAYNEPGEGDIPKTYAYPNPFSPTRHNQLNGEGHVRFQYSVEEPTYVTVKVYDFAMDLVTTVCEDKFRTGPASYSEVWNGKNDYLDDVANGVYFYSVKIDGDDTHWGKVMIVN